MQVIYPILMHLLPRLAEAKKRAYLARYLVQVQVPTDVLQNAEVAATNDKYLELVEAFKETHKQMEEMQNSGFSADSVKADIRSMEQEKHQLAKRTERIRKKSEGLPQYGEMLGAARKLRREQERETDLQKQAEKQRAALSAAQEEHERTGARLREVRSAQVQGGAQGLLARLEEETKMNHYLDTEKLPQLLAEREKTHSELRGVVNEPMTQDDLMELHGRISALTAEVNGLIERRMKSDTAGDSNLTLYRQQASIILRKKEAAAERLKDAEEHAAKMEQELGAKKAEVAAKGPQITQEAFKKYVASLRTKSSTYRTKKAELSDIQSEGVVLDRTKTLLGAKAEALGEAMLALEERHGVAGFADTRAKLEEVSAASGALNEQKAETLEDISAMVTQLNSTIAAKKAALAPLIAELREVRTRAQRLEADYEGKKQTYTQMNSGLESAKSKLAHEVHALREEAGAHESRYHHISAMVEILAVHQQRVKEEEASYIPTRAERGAAPQEKKRSVQTQLKDKIERARTWGRRLQEKQKQVVEDHDANMQQLEMWRDLAALLEVKVRQPLPGAPDALSSGLAGGENVLVL